MQTTLAYKTANFGSWGEFVLFQPITPKPKPPRTPAPEPPTLALVPKRSAVYAKGMKLTLQHPARSRFVNVEAEVTRRWHAVERPMGKKRAPLGMYWMYELVIEGDSYLLSEEALTQQVETGRANVLRFAKELPADARLVG